MGSRLKQEPDKIFEVFIEFVREAQGDEEHGRVARFYPRDFSDEDVLKPSLKFAFPYTVGSHRCEQEYFTFVMTDINSKFKFGFCLLHSDGHVERNYCFVSCLPWFEPFYPLLAEISARLSRQDQEGASVMLSKLHESSPKGPSQIICLTPPTWDKRFNFVCPIVPSLPSIPQNKNFSELFRSFRVGNLMVLFSSILFERRILMFGSSVERLTSCIHGLNQLIYPMCWQHLFIPILPPSLLDYCSAPMPYIIGLHSSTMTRLHKMEYSDAVLVNLDENKVCTEHADLPAIPHDVVSTLKKQLKLQKAHMEKGSLIGDGVSKAFLAAMVSLIGGYRNAMRFHDGADITFDPDIFVTGSGISRDPSNHVEYRRFFEMVLHMQSFQQFISDRLDIMNAGKGFQDAFDTAVTSMSGDEDRWKTQSRYKDWLTHMKKQGKMLKREGKDKWTVFASKVKSKSKKTWKEIKSRLDDKKDEPASQVKSSKLARQYKPPRPPPPLVPKDLRTATLLRSGMMRRSSLERTQRYNLLDVDILDSKASSINNDSDDNLSHLKRVDTNLSNDPELLSWMARPRYEILSDMYWIKKSYSVEGIYNAKENEDLSRSALDTSVSSIGNDSLAKSYSSANMMVKRLESLDVSSVGSSSTDVLGREGLTIDGRNELARNPNFMSASLSYTFRDTSTNNSNQSPRELNGDDCRDLMDFGSSNSSIEFDPLKQKVADMSFIDQKPTPLPRTKSKNINLDFNSLSIGSEGSGKMSAGRDRDLSVLPPPLPLPRKRDAASLQYYHHRKQTLNLNPQKSLKDDRGSDSENSFKGSISNSNAEPDAGTSEHLADDGQSLATNTKLARSLFLQSDCNIPLSNLGLESFDPLASGQLIIDCPKSMSTPTNPQKTDEELLKDWDLLDIARDAKDVSFNSAPDALQYHQVLKIPTPNYTGFYPNQMNFATCQQNLHSASPIAVANNPNFKAQNISGQLRHPSAAPRAHKSSTLPLWTTSNVPHNARTSNASIGRTTGSGGLWETFE